MQRHKQPGFARYRVHNWLPPITPHSRPKEISQIPSPYANERISTANRGASKPFARIGWGMPALKQSTATTRAAEAYDSPRLSPGRMAKPSTKNLPKRMPIRNSGNRSSGVNSTAICRWSFSPGAVVICLARYSATGAASAIIHKPNIASTHVDFFCTRPTRGARNGNDR